MSVASFALEQGAVLALAVVVIALALWALDSRSE